MSSAAGRRGVWGHVDMGFLKEEIVQLYLWKGPDIRSWERLASDACSLGHSMLLLSLSSYCVPVSG